MPVHLHELVDRAQRFPGHDQARADAEGIDRVALCVEGQDGRFVEVVAGDDVEVGEWGGEARGDRLEGGTGLAR